MRISRFTRCSLAFAALSMIFAGCSGGGGPQLTPAANPGVLSQPQAASASVDATSTQVDWTQTYFNSAHIGFNAKETTISTANVGNLTTLWNQTITGGVTGFAINKGTIFAQESNSSGLPALVAINQATGNILWTTTTGSDGYALNGTVEAGAGNVYVGCGSASTGNPGGVCAYKAATGKLVWSYIPDCKCQFNGTVQSPPVYSNGVVYYGASGFPGQSDPYVVALNAQTGVPMWSYDPGPGALGSAPLAVSGGNVFFDCVVPGNVEGICAVAQSGGALLWHATTGATTSAFSIAAGVLYASNVQNFVVALNAATGAGLWSSSGAIGKSMYPPAIASGAVYVAGNTTLSSLQGASGKQRWSKSLSCAPQSSPSVADGVVYVYQGGNNCPAVSAFNAKTGAQLSSFTISTASFGVSPVIENGTLYVADGVCGSLCAYVPQASSQTVPAVASR